MDIYLIDGTYELFRYFYAVPSSKNASGQEIGAVRGVLGSILTMIEGGATHIGVATDHVIESFRNDLYRDYKTGEGVDPELLSQFPILEEALQSMGVLVWPMIEFEADDALASAAAKTAKDKRVRRVIICTPDKDLSQCVVGTRVVLRKPKLVMFESINLPSTSFACTAVRYVNFRPVLCPKKQLRWRNVQSPYDRTATTQDYGVRQDPQGLVKSV